MEPKDELILGAIEDVIREIEQTQREVSNLGNFLSGMFRQYNHNHYAYAPHLTNARTKLMSIRELMKSNADHKHLLDKDEEPRHVQEKIYFTNVQQQAQQQWQPTPWNIRNE